MMKYFLFLGVFFGLMACSGGRQSSEDKKELDKGSYYKLQGEAQGTYYSIIYEDERDLSEEVDSILKRFDKELSIYDPTSIISNLNQSEDNCFPIFERLEDQGIFAECFHKAKEVYTKTKGSFNPAVYPLVKYWGFLNFEESALTINQEEIDSLLLLVNFDDSSYQYDEDTLRKGVTPVSFIPKVCKENLLSKIDFNAIAQGYSVDVVARYLDGLGIENYMVEIGGEVNCKGKNNKGRLWTIGIDKPVEGSNPGSEGFQVILQLENTSLATSGNYRKFYEKDGIKYSHTIDPNTGRPVTHSLLSVSVVTKESAFADAYATAFMVMGVDSTIQFLEQNKDLNLLVYLVFDDGKGGWETWMSPEFGKMIIE